MAKVNINDRTALEQAYPEEAFTSDAAQNDLPNPVIHGVRIGAAPDVDGWFELERATRHAGEPETPYFLTPTATTPKSPRGYAQFLDDIVAAAKRFGFRAEQSPGRGEKRLRGFHGG